MRNNGDDAMATWSAFDGPQQCFNNEFRFCTAENTWRAGGIGFFGGGGHKGHHLLIKDSTENGIRINSDFPVVGSSFSSTLWIEVYETTVIGCGTNANLWHNRYGAVDIFTRLYNVQNFRLRNVDIQGSQKDAVMIYDVASTFRIFNLEFINVTLNGAGLDGNINNYTPATFDDYAGHGIYVLPETDGSMTITNTNICNTPSGQTRNDSGATFVINGAVGSTCSGNTNNAPVANAGPDQNLTSGITSANLSGSATDANGDPITFSWSQISGPTVTIANSSNANTSVTGLSSGNTYIFRLSASDGRGGIGVDDVQITVQSAPSNLPAPWVTTDVGAVAATGSASFNSSPATFTANGSGADIWDTADEFRYIYQPINGDVTITARVASLTNTNAWAKAGVMIRASTAAGSQHAFTAVTPGNGLNFQRRITTNGASDNTAGGAGAAPYWVRLQRVGNTFTSSVSTNGATWTTIGSATISMGATAQVGLAVTSHADGTIATATFTNVQTSMAANVPVTGVTVSPTSQSLAVGSAVQLVPTVAPANATNKSVTYTSNNTAVATVNSSGLVSAVSAGSAVITVTTVDQGKTATSAITVTGVATAFRIRNRWQNTYLFDAGDRVRYSATASGAAYNWVLENIGGGQIEIRNVGTGEYMHIENLTGYVQCTTRTVGWMSSRWTTENAGGGFVRFKNVWQSSNYIHVENLAGHAQHGTIFPVWESAQWVLEPVPGGSAAMGVSPEQLSQN
jgi:regulation of enolase protein 1 (concanavalin A-like superfamily)